VERFRPLPSAKKQAWRAALGLPTGPLIIYTGRLETEKRIDQLIGIWPAVRACHPEAVLLILGTGAEESRLKQMAGAGILFLGHVENVAGYLQASDIFVLPSATEGLSNALLEALAAGLPVIATAVGGAPEAVAHLQHGWLIPPDTPAALQEAVLALLNNAACRDSLGYRGRQRAVEHYALPTTANRLRDLYERLIQS
jgi:glycosyltransferase involved in cell wall biosynthesis